MTLARTCLKKGKQFSASIFQKALIRNGRHSTDFHKYVKSSHVPDYSVRVHEKFFLLPGNYKFVLIRFGKSYCSQFNGIRVVVEPQELILLVDVMEVFISFEFNFVQKLVRRKFWNFQRL